ncbi:ABC transporter ATP-binding protein [Leifsonia sp. 2TAF2]|uniref:ABC transporter ATP-binding protein n=1 Tax=Leifsonia sp. 2TAF2 TaxID=3233009 RepID=UPI003F94A545
MPLLELEGVTRVVPIPDDEPLRILSGVDLVVDAGEHVSIVGRSGSGKSTLLNILGLLDEPTDGSITFDGVPVRRMSSADRDRRRGREVGFIFQQFNLLPGRTAVENVATPLLYAEPRRFWRRRRLALEMLDRVGLANRAEWMPSRLSGGEQQRVAIARALVRNPRVILADEPTGALDVQTGQSVMQLLDSVAHDTQSALVTITHDPAIAALADRRFRLDGGILHAEQPEAVR